MSLKKIVIETANAPAAIGSYSQAIRVADQLYLSGQIPIDPNTGHLIAEDFSSQVHQVFRNIQAICEAADASLENIIKLSVYLIDLQDFSTLNDIMPQYFSSPYPARVTFQVAALPKNALVEIEAIAAL